MGYNGFREHLCANGHYTTRDAWDDDPEGCPSCGARLTHFHGVDQTNGYDESHPSTCRAPKEETGFDDVWHVDHHGNKYATKLPKFRPLANWLEVKMVAT